MPHLLSPVLSRWEVDPPAIQAAEAYGGLREVFGILRGQALVRPMAPAGAADCTECGQRCPVDYIPDRNGGQAGFIHCDCGIAPVPDHLLRRWQIDTRALLAAVFSGIRLSVDERVAGRLWQVGKANWAGRPREVWFARAFRATAALDMLRSRPKAIVFAPTEIGAERWCQATGNLVIALDSTLSIDCGSIVFDSEYVEGRIVDAGLGPDAVSKRRVKRRADRTAKIELLKKELIQHLQAARDHAFETLHRIGQPQLLPRPLRKELGALTGLRKYDVTKCFQDPESRELNLYWDIALDLEQIMAWKGPIKRGRPS